MSPVQPEPSPARSTVKPGALTPDSKPTVGLGGRVRFWAAFHVQRHLRRRGFLLWVAASAVLFGVLRAFGPSGPEATLEAGLIGLLPLSSLFFGVGPLRDEIDDQTLTYSFSRPVGRGWIYLARVFAAIAPVALLSAVPLVMVADLATGAQLGRAAACCVLGVASYVALFGVLGLLFRRAALLGLAYLIFWEAGVSQVPGFLGRLTLMTHLRSLAGLKPAGGVLADLWAPPSPYQSAVALLAVAIVASIVGAQLVRIREHPITQ